MTRYFTVHPDNPQQRIMKQTVEALKKDALIVYPTDSCYALGCSLQNKSAVETIRTLRNLQPKHPLTLICSDIAQAAEYAFIDNYAYKYFKQLTPGPYTFILPATKKVPKLVVGEKRKVVGIRIPNHPVALELIAQFGEPLLSSTLLLAGEDTPIQDPHDIPQTPARCVNYILDAGFCSQEMTTVVELISHSAKIIREGAGDISPFEV